MDDIGTVLGCQALSRSVAIQWRVRKRGRRAAPAGSATIDGNLITNLVP